MKQPEYIQIGLKDRFSGTIVKMFGPAMFGQWVLLRMELAKSPTLSIDINQQLDFDYLRLEIAASEEEFRKLLDHAARCGQIDRSLYLAGIIWSQPLADELQPFFKMTKKKTIPAPTLAGIFPKGPAPTDENHERSGTYPEKFQESGDLPGIFPKGPAPTRKNSDNRIDMNRIEENRIEGEFSENSEEVGRSHEPFQDAAMEAYVRETQEIMALSLEFIREYGKNGSPDKVQQELLDAIRFLKAKHPELDVGTIKKTILGKAALSRQKDQAENVEFRVKPETWLSGKQYLLDYGAGASQPSNEGKTKGKKQQSQWSIPVDREG